MNTTTWFWGTPEWRAYCDAYGGGWRHNFGDANLVARLGPEEEMLRRMSKGHRSAIHAAEKRLSVGVGWFEDYRLLHRMANGEVRSGATFDLMRSWLGKYGLVLCAYEGDDPVAAAYLLSYEGGSYYASAPRNPHIRANGAAHLLVWKGMCILANGHRWLDFGPLPAVDASEKQVSIAAFKKHFGAVPMTWPDYP